jgi:hypothetical protein
MDNDRETEDCPDCAGRPGSPCATCYGAGYVFPRRQDVEDEEDNDGDDGKLTSEVPF